MVKIDFSKLNSLEKKIYVEIEPIIKKNHHISITELSILSKVSTSKLSKFSKKCGLESFKQFKNYIAGIEQVEPQKSSIEIQRVREYLNNFDYKMVEQFVDQIKNCKKLIIFGYGPSFFCAEYFAYRLRTLTNIFVTVTHEDAIIENSANQDTILLVLSCTGKFKSFDELVNKLNYHRVIFIFEEFRHFPQLNQHSIFYLTTDTGNPNLLPYEKSRTLFFIFLEEILQTVIRKSTS